MNTQGLNKTYRELKSSKRRITAFTAVTISVWIFFILSSDPLYSFQMITADPSFFTEVFTTLLLDQVEAGALNVAMPVMLSGLIAAVTVMTSITLMQNYKSSSSITGTLGSALGITGAGCATCGAGLLTLVGVTGGLAFLPFDGLEIQILSILILIGVLEYTGRQHGVCKI